MRIRLSEITPKRIVDAVHRRIEDIPDAIAWKYSELASSNKERLSHYRNIHRGKRCFVMANGPSLGEMQLQLLRDEYTISMNRAYLLYE